MKRRHFLQSTALLSTASLLGTVQANPAAQTHASCEGTPAQRRRFTLTQTHNLTIPQGSSGVVKLWVPLPEQTSFQQLRKLTFKGNFKDAFVTADNAYGAQTLYATWPDSQGQPTLTVEMLIDTLDWEIAAEGQLAAYRAPAKISYPLEVQPYLQATPHMPTNGIVKETAEKIVKTETNPLKKARLLYNWVSSNMFRDNAVIGCGTGDVADILKSGKLGGKCTDINSVFVALCRAVGIPAREMFGIRLGKAIKMAQHSKTAFGSADATGLSNVTGAQHCRAMFYLAGFGWVPADPADVTKMRLTEKKEHTDPAVQTVNDYLFGNWEMNWVGFNYGRDFDLSPEAEQTPLNNFGYPYAEVDGDPLNYYEPKLFTYDYLSKE